MTKDRNSNIELLRIVLALAVIILHYNNPDIGGALSVSRGMNYNLLVILESFSICAVNTFVLISGYYLCKSGKRETIKAFLLVLQVMVFKLAGYILNVVIAVRAGENIESILGLKQLLIVLLPNNYYVILYIAIYFISLYFNVALKVLKEKKVLKQMMIVLILLLSVEPTLVDLLEDIFQNDLMGLSMISYNGSLAGYSIVNFGIMYLVGAYIRLEDLGKKCGAKKAFLGLMLCVIITSGWSLLNNVLYFDTTETAWAYSNPVIIAEAAFMFILFENIHIGNIKVVNMLAKASFTVYLLHIMFLKYVRISEFCNRNAFILLLHILLVCMVVYVICWIIYEIYHFVEKIFISILQRIIRFPEISVENEK